MPSPQLPQGWRKRLRTRRLLTALAGPALTPGIESTCAHTPRACSRARLCTQAAGRCGWTPQPRKPCSPHPHKHGRRSPRKGMRQESGMETPAPRHRLLGGLTGGVESAAEPGSRGGRGRPRRAHHQNFGRVLQLSDHFWGPQRRRHHGLSSMTRHALHSGKGVAADQSARPGGLRAPGRLRRAGLGRGRGDGVVLRTGRGLWQRMRAAGLGGSRTPVTTRPGPARTPALSWALRSALRPTLRSACGQSPPVALPEGLASSVPASVPLGHKRTYSERNTLPTGGPARGVQVDWDSRPLRPQRKGRLSLAKAASHRRK